MRGVTSDELAPGRDMATSPKLLVSACLLGRPVRYDGTARPLASATLERWQRQGRVVGICPELLGGFPTPRPAAEIANLQGGDAVLDGKGRVFEESGTDVSSQFLQGASMALQLALDHQCRFALLMDGSPSCGSTFLYDGSFSGSRHAGEGVTAALLRRYGIIVFTPERIDDLASAMDD